MELMVRELLEDGEIKLDPHPDGIGIKASMGHLFSEKPVKGEVERFFLQFYVQSRIPDVPSDPEIGFTEEDLTFDRCVIIADVEAEASFPPQYYGEAIDLETFKEEFIDTTALEIRLDRLFDRLEQRATPRDGWLAHVSGLYNDRLVGWNSFIKERNTH